MPMTPFQREVMTAIARNRDPESYVAGAIAIHHADGSPRYSHDLDLFHESLESVARAVAADERSLREFGARVEFTVREPGFVRAVVGRGDQLVKIEWARDTAFRFFPIEPDDVLGYRLHPVDAAVNKILTLAGRAESRDLVDVLHIHDHVLSLAGQCWAACGKDPGFTPELLLNEAARHAIVRPDQLRTIALTRPLDPRDLKRRWLAALAEAQERVRVLPTAELGCLYLDRQGRPVDPPASAEARAPLTRHFGSLRGAWPQVIEA